MSVLAHPTADRWPALRTERAFVHMPHPARADAVLAYFERNRAHLEPWEPARPTGFYTRQHWAQRLAVNREEWMAGVSARFFVERGERVIGSMNFTNVVGGVFRACSLGYSLDAREVGKGLMAEALGAAVPFVCAQLGLHRVMANYQPSNARSGALLRRLGFVIEGYARDYLYIDGAWRDHVLTSYVWPDAPLPDPT